MEKFTTGMFQTNTYLLISKDECILIDPGFDIDECRKMIEKDKKKVVAILLTHCHCDHVDSIGLFDCPIYIHEDDYESLNNEVCLYDMVGVKKSFDFKKLNLIKFKDKETLDISRFTIETIHTPGHTKGSSCFIYKDMIFTGDTLFKESIGRTDFPTGDHKEILISLKKIIKEVDHKLKVCPGHGDYTTLKDEVKNNLFIKTI